MTLNSNTRDHSRIRRPKAARLGSSSTGQTAVIVFSVKSCIWPRITSMKPTEYPKLSISGRH